MSKDSLSVRAFKEGILRLEAAFRVNPLQETSLKIYYEKLKEACDQTFTAAVEECIEQENFFPSIACLIAHCGLEKHYDAAGRELEYK